MSSRIRILQLITDLEQAGAEWIVFHLARGLARRGYHVQVASLWRSGHDPGGLADGLIESGIPVHCLEIRSKVELGKLRSLVGLIRRERFDVVHTHLWHADMAGRLARLFLPGSRPILFSTIHTAERRWMPWRFFADRLTRRLCHEVVCVSGSVRDHHARRTRLPPHDYRVISNGVDLDRLSRLPDRAAARARWGLPPGAAVVGTVARLEPEKNLAMLIRAFDELRRDFPEAHLLIAGAGRLDRSLRRAVDAAGLEDVVHMIGFQADVRPVLAAIDVFALPSRWEGFGLATAEAMCCGLPVIVTDVPGSCDLVCDGRTGWVVPDDTPGALAAALAEALGDKAEASRRGAAAADYARSHFSVDAMVAGYCQAYQRALYGHK